jgi:hypothetical protein
MVVFISSKLVPTGRGVGHYLIVDDVMLYYHTIGIPVSNDALSEGFIYPNPASDVVNLRFELTNNQEITISISDINGRQVKSGQYDLKSGMQQLQIGLQGIPSGTYLISIGSGKERYYSSNLLINK